MQFLKTKKQKQKQTKNQQQQHEDIYFKMLILFL